MNEEQKQIKAILDQMSRYNRQLADSGVESVRDMEALARSLRSRMNSLEELNFTSGGRECVDPEALHAFSTKLLELREQVRDCMTLLGDRMDKARGRVRATGQRRKLFQAYGGTPAAPRPRFQKHLH